MNGEGDPSCIMHHHPCNAMAKPAVCRDPRDQIILNQAIIKAQASRCTIVQPFSVWHVILAIVYACLDHEC